MNGLNIIKNFYYYEELIEDIVPLHSQLAHKDKGGISMSIN